METIERLLQWLPDPLYRVLGALFLFVTVGTAVAVLLDWVIP